jgi:2,3-dimethylmalate lyase
MQGTEKEASLRKQIEDKNKIMVLPGVFDALSARIAEQVGFQAIFQTGYGSAAALLGMPDFGFLNAGETVDNARRIIRAVNIPVIIDIDTGYGNPLTVWRLVSDLESMGAAGVFLEDQTWPKRCGHMKGKEVIPKDDYLQKLKAALDARKGRDFIIVERTDARATLGLEEAIIRGKAYKKNGADVVFVEAPKSEVELKTIADQISAPLVANMIEGGATPFLTAKELFEIGYRIGVFPLSGLFAATYAIKQVFTDLKEKGTTESSHQLMTTFEEFNRFVDLQKYMELDRRYTQKT